MDDGTQRGALAPYRVLDLTTERGWLCARMLADLGADVVKVEPPGGDPGRCHPPFHGDVADPERNLRWWHLNRGKRSIVLDLEAADGRATLLDLVASADLLVESFEPGWMAAQGLGVDVLLERNPALVVTSITPFGQDGPYAGWRGPDLIVGATSGPIWLTGDPDRAPLRVSVPQMDLHASAEGAVHTVVALQHAARSGEGQHVDVSAQLAGIRTLMNASSYPYLEHRELARTGGAEAPEGGRNRMMYRCADGHVAATIGGGGAMRMLQPLLDWMQEEGGLPDWIRDLDWPTLDAPALAEEAATAPPGQSLVERISGQIATFFSTRTKAECYAAAIERGILLAPVNTVADLLADEQLQARGYFVDVDHGELGTVTFPGPWARMSGTPLQPLTRAPRVGEHTDEVLAERRPATPAAAPAVPRRQPTEPDRRGGDPFAGLKVWDMSWVGVGPLTARYLADYGATVIRLDSSKRPETLRLGPPFKDGIRGLNRSHFYGDYNASKLGMGLDVMHPMGREVALELVRWADVLLESFTPKTMAAWGMSYEDLRRENPRLVMYSTCMQGQTGPRKDYRGYGTTMAALAGYYDVTGWPDRDPTPVYGAYTDFMCQRWGATALTAAVEHQRRTGEGQHIDLSQFEAGTQFLGTEIMDAAANGRVAARNGNRDPDMAPHGVYPCRPAEGAAEAWVAIAVEDDGQWEALRVGHGRSGVGRRPRAGHGRRAPGPRAGARRAAGGVDRRPDVGRGGGPAPAPGGRRAGPRRHRPAPRSADRPPRLLRRPGAPRAGRGPLRRDAGDALAHAGPPAAPRALRGPAHLRDPRGDPRQGRGRDRRPARHRGGRDHLSGAGSTGRAPVRPVPAGSTYAPVDRDRRHLGGSDVDGRSDGGGALAPYRVLDLTTERGWLCARLLGDLGADVVKVEPPGGDPGRRRGPFQGDVPDPERNLRWWHLNRGKRSVALDLETDEGRATLLELVDGADVLVESFEPGWMDAHGLAADALLARNPRLVVTSITPFGQDGPWASHRGPDLIRRRRVRAGVADRRPRPRAAADHRARSSTSTPRPRGRCTPSPPSSTPPAPARASTSTCPRSSPASGRS